MGVGKCWTEFGNLLVKITTTFESEWLFIYYYYFYENTKFKEGEFWMNSGCFIALRDVALSPSKANLFFLLKKEH